MIYDNIIERPKKGKRSAQASKEKEREKNKGEA